MRYTYSYRIKRIRKSERSFSMEALIAAAVIIVLLLISGVGLFSILAGLLCFCGLLLIFMTVFFAVSLILMLSGKRVDAKLLRLSKRRNITCAVYEIDGEEVFNSFPAEVILATKIHRIGRISSARLLHRKNGKVLLFDWYARLIILIGLPVSAASAAAFALFLPTVISF